MTGPVIPCQACNAGRGRPEIGGYVDFENVRGGVVEGGDYDGLVDVFCGKVEDFPSSCVVKDSVIILAST